MSPIPGPHLLSLPYDVRYLIYEHLFPPDEQIYIQVIDGTMKSILPEHHISTNLSRVSRHFHAEANDYLYNNYLFNIVGTKKDCLASYESFAGTLRKYAKDDVRINAFSNGVHSSTMCVSLHAGDGKMVLLNRRMRGEPREIREMREELGLNQDRAYADRLVQMVRATTRRRRGLVFAVCAVLVSALSMLVAWSL